MVPLAVDHLWALGGGTWMSLAGFSGALADKGGPYRTRAETLATLTVGAAACATLGGLAGSDPYLAVPLTFMVALAASLGRAYGNAGASVGISVLNAFVISLAYPAADLHEALLRGAFTIVGGLWAMALSLLIWPLRPYRPVRLAVAAAYRAVGAYAVEVARAAREGGTPGPRPVRASLEAAHAALATVRRGRPGESGRGERLVVLGEGADQLYGHLFGLSDVVDTIGSAPGLQPARDALGAAAEAAGATAFAIADAVESEDEASPVPVAWRGDGVRSALAALAADDTQASDFAWPR